MKYSSIEIIEMAEYILQEMRKKNCKKYHSLPEFTEEEVRAIFELVFDKSERIQLQIRERIKSPGFTFRRKQFISQYLATMGNGAKAARLSGYSPRCAKQIAWRLLRS